MKLGRAYVLPLGLLLAIVAACLLGWLAPDVARAIRPLGDLFLNAIFVLVVPLVFFTVASGIARAGGRHELGRVSSRMLAAFALTTLVAAGSSLLFMLAWQLTPGSAPALPQVTRPEAPNVLAQFVKAVTAADLGQLLTPRNMLPLILFSAAVGYATSQCGEQAAAFANLLASGRAVFLRLIAYVMWIAPLGLLAYFSGIVVDTGAELGRSYLDVFVAYHVFAACYFVVGFSCYAFLAGGGPAVKRLWAQMAAPALTAIGTCSSLATMPVNLEAAPKMGVPRAISDVVIPVGAVLHKDGSVIGGVAKVLFAFGLFHEALSPAKLLLAFVVAMAVGVVVGAIPSGGLIGELLILSVFGFPPEALPLLAVISIIIDPVATLLNATGDNVAALLVTRWVEGDRWRPAAPDDAAE